MFSERYDLALDRVFAKKNVFFGDGSAEASAAFSCQKINAERPGHKAAVRVRMHYDAFSPYADNGR